MTAEELIPLSRAEDWNRALHGLRHSFAHTWENCYGMYLTTGFPTYLYTLRTPRCRIVCPFAERPFRGSVDIVSPYGFSGFVGEGECADVAQWWDRFVKRQRYVCGYIFLSPFFSNVSSFRHEELRPSRTVYCLDVGQPIDSLFARLDRNRRRQLSTFETDLVRRVTDRGKIAEFLVSEHPRFAERVSASRASRFSPDTLRHLCHCDNVLTFGMLGQDSDLEAAYLFGLTRDAADALLNVATRAGRKHTTSLLWAGIRELQARAVPTLNLGGGVRENDSIAQAKLRFGAHGVRCQCLKQVYDEDAYESLCRLAGVDHRDTSGYFPAYRSG